MVEIPTLPDSVDNAVKNLTDKPTASIGQTISDLWQLVLGGRVSYAVEKQKIKYAHCLEEYRTLVEKGVSAVPVDKLIEPPLQIAAQALEDSQYCIESEELRKLFANLITRSMHADYSERIHPSFSKIAQQLSPLDAQMLCILRNSHDGRGIAVVNYIAKNDKQPGYGILRENIPADMPPHCTPDDAARSLVSLTRLGLVDIPADAHFTDADRYSVFEQTPLYQDCSNRAVFFGHKMEMQKRMAKLTVLGKDFVSVCLD